MDNLGFVIHGTNNGSRIVYTSSNLAGKLFNFEDYRGNTVTDAINSECYSIASNLDFVLFTKFKIILDKKRGQDSLGYVALSLVIPCYIEIDEKYLITTIDEVFSIYIESTVNNDFEYEDKNDTTLFKRIEDILQHFTHFKKKSSTLITETLLTEPAFMFFDSDEELIKIISNPYRSEFSKYPDVLLLHSSKKDKINALSALKHDPNADLTNKINLHNPDYTITTKIAEGITLNGITDGVKVKLKDKVSFGFAKEFNKTETPNYSGSWQELIDRFPNIVFKSREFPNTIVIKSPRFAPDVKKITLKFKDVENNKTINPNYLEYTIKSGDKTKNISNDQIELSGDEIGRNWEIKVNKNAKYKASSSYFNPTFETSKTISLEPVSPPFNWKPILTGVFSLVIFGVIGYLGYKGYNSLFSEKNEDKSLVNNKPSFDNSQIRDYIQRNELNIDSLESFKNLTSDSLLIIELSDLIRFRMSLNTIYRDTIQALHDSFDKLSIAKDKDKKKLLASILDSINFSNDYKTITNREFMTFHQIEDTINSIIRIKRNTTQTELVPPPQQPNELTKAPTEETVINEQATSTNNVNQDSEVKKSKYTDSEFIEKIFNSQEPESSKMTELMQEIVELKKEKGISGKVFKDIVSIEGHNLERIALKLKNSN